MNTLKDRTAIAGIGQTEFSSNSGRSELRLAVEATLAACEDAGIQPSEIDGMARFSMDEVGQHQLAAALGLPNLRFFAELPYGGGGACGTAAAAALAVAAGQAKVVLCWRSLNERSGVRFGQPLAGYMRAGGDMQFMLPFGVGTPAQMAAFAARRHMHQYGTTVEQFAALTLNSRRYATTNPAARFYGRPLTMEDYLNGRMVSEPLRIFDCCLESDGAVAVLVTSAERSRDLKQAPAYIAAAAQGMGSRTIQLLSYARRDITISEETTACAADLWAMAGLGPEDMDVAQVYDHFAPLALMALEDFGFVPKGEVGPWVAAGALGPKGELPTNTAGGLVGEGYIHGMNLITEAVRQLRGTAANQAADVRHSFVASANGVPTSALILRK